MKHHYIVFAWMKFDAVCRMGTQCGNEDELRKFLHRKNVKGYKLISVDDDEMSGWSDKDWTLL